MELQSYSLKFVVVIIGIFFGIVTELTTFFYINSCSFHL